MSGKTVTVTAENIRPYVRCVGIGEGLRQREYHKAYDHRLVAFLDGSGHAQIDGETFPMPAGSAFIAGPGTAYRVRCGEGQKIAVVNFDWTYSCAGTDEVLISVTPDRFCEEGITEKADFSLLYSGGKPWAVLRFPVEQADVFETLYHSWFLREQNSLQQLRLTAQLQYILTAVLQDKMTAPRASGAAEALWMYIRANYEKEITLADAAARFHYSTSYVSRLLRKYYHCSFKQLVIRCRSKRALWLLENTNMTHEEVAAQTGFYDGRHLSRTLAKKHTEKPSR